MFRRKWVYYLYVPSPPSCASFLVDDIYLQLLLRGRLCEAGAWR